MKPVNMNDGGRNLSLGGSRGAMEGGVITAPHYSEEIAKAAKEWGIKAIDMLMQSYQRRTYLTKKQLNRTNQTI